MASTIRRIDVGHAMKLFAPHHDTAISLTSLSLAIIALWVCVIEFEPLIEETEATPQINEHDENEVYLHKHSINSNGHHSTCLSLTVSKTAKRSC